MRTRTVIQITPAVAGWHAVYLGQDDAIRLDPIVCWALVEVADDVETYRIIEGISAYARSDGSSSIGVSNDGFAFDSGFLSYAPPGRTAANYKNNAEALAAARAESEASALVDGLADPQISGAHVVAPRQSAAGRELPRSPGLP